MIVSGWQDKRSRDSVKKLINIWHTLRGTALHILLQPGKTIWKGTDYSRRWNFANCGHILFRRGFFLAILPNKPYLISRFLILLLWTLTFNILNEACKVWDLALRNFSEHGTIWPWGDFAGMSTPGKADNHLGCFAVVIFLIV